MKNVSSLLFIQYIAKTSKYSYVFRFRMKKAVIGTLKFKEEYVNNIVKSWVDQLEVLSDIEEIISSVSIFCV